ncbi:hypothetical protein B5G09_03955 [Alistipes sp. An54]|nr:hypothetical protein B5G09_03955 [Alistipes sp. An54]
MQPYPEWMLHIISKSRILRSLIFIIWDHYPVTNGWSKPITVWRGYIITVRRIKKVFYDKIKESSYRKDRVPEGYSDRYLLRYELRLKNHVNRMFGVDKITVPMLYDVQFYRRIVDFWKGEYRKIVKVNEYEIDIEGCKGIRDLNKMGMLMLVERYGGMNEFFKTFDHQFELGVLDKRQLSEIKRQTKQLLENRSLEIVRNPQIEELNSLIEQVG